ncbi:hypothetical protein [Tenggerimyces flavus]|uniref:Uncharacterized protein n=1 Tax=Tenggerimyces flavus TaxID=1708749 RepID=A0ABV7YNF0_9ACTN|nr:hypothetical protein [Tenggerimyces flavus]MBM7786501.1 hypothetical protein [Tenggerimyces flavus]
MTTQDTDGGTAVTFCLVDVTAHLAAVRARLSQLEARLLAARPGELDWAFWNEILELVEELPAEDEELWKRMNLDQLRHAVDSSFRNDDEI